MGLELGTWIHSSDVRKPYVELTAAQESSQLGYSRTFMGSLVSRLLLTLSTVRTALVSRTASLVWITFRQLSKHYSSKCTVVHKFFSQQGSDLLNYSYSKLQITANALVFSELSSHVQKASQYQKYSGCFLNGVDEAWFETPNEITGVGEGEDVKMKINLN